MMDLREEHDQEDLRAAKGIAVAFLVGLLFWGLIVWAFW